MEDRHASILAVYLILEQDDCVLLLRRFNTGYCDGQYSFPAGHVERNESITTAVIREAWEEIGINVNPEDLHLSHIRDRNCDDGHRIDFFFTCSRWSGEPVNAEPTKCSDLQWFKNGTQPENCIPYIQEVLQHIADGRGYSLENW